MVRGFRRSVGENIRSALDLEFFKSLKHARYNYLKVLPREYILDLETNQCLLNVNEIVELKAHYNRGWESYENLRRFPKRLNEEQASLHLDGVIINNDENSTTTYAEYTAAAH